MESNYNQKQILQ